VTLARLVQLLNIWVPRDENAVLPLSKVALVNVGIPANTASPIVKTAFGIVILVRRVLTNAELLISETVLGIVKLVKDVQSRNILFAIVVKRFPKVTLDRVLQEENIWVPRDENAVLPLSNVAFVNVVIL